MLTESIELKSKCAKTADGTHGSDLEVENRGGATGFNGYGGNGNQGRCVWEI